MAEPSSTANSPNKSLFSAVSFELLRGLRSYAAYSQSLSNSRTSFFSPFLYLPCKSLVRDIPAVAQCTRNAMSLPGLGLSEPSVEAQYVPPPPTQISLSKGSEWRFEVAFGRTVRVKVCSLSPPFFPFSLISISFGCCICSESWCRRSSSRELSICRRVLAI